MPDDVKHSDDDLDLDVHEDPDEDTEGDDGSTDDAEDTDEDDPSASLDLDEKKEADDKKDVAKHKQVKGLASKILTGELSYETFPEAQKWLLPDVIEYVAKAKGTTEDTSSDIIDEKVQKALKKEKYVNLLDSVKKANLSREENISITERFKFLRSKTDSTGDPVFSKLEALEDALKVTRVDLSKIKAKQPSIRDGGSKRGVTPTVEDSDIDDINTMSPAQMAKLKGGV